MLKHRVVYLILFFFVLFLNTSLFSVLDPVSNMISTIFAVVYVGIGYWMCVFTNDCGKPKE